MNIRKLFVVIAALVVMVSLTTSAAFAQDPDNGKVAWEEQVWQCQQCHGANGEGLWVRPLSNSESTAQEWIEQVRNPRRFMPAFSEAQVTDEQIIDMHAYVTSLPEPAADFAPQDAGTFASDGQNLMAQKRCIACHTDEVQTGQGRRITDFVEQGIVPTADIVIAQLRTPRNFMPSFSEDQVSDEEAALIADYLAEQVSSQLPAGDVAPAPSEETSEAAPEALPQSGADQPAQTPLVLLLSGVGVFMLGLLFRLRRVIGR